MTKINLHDSTQDAVIKMAEGNMGALNALVMIIKEGSVIDPDDPMSGIGTILMLDTLGIYGSDIYVLYSDICDKNIAKTIAVVRAVQFGHFDGRLLQNACNRQDYSGRDIVPVDELYQKVKDRLQNFDKHA